MNTKTLLLLALSAALLPFGAQAKPEDAPGSKDKKGPPSPEQIVERMDADQSGTISLDEAKGPLAKNFVKVDADNDGELTVGELQAAHEKRKTKAEGKGEKLKEADTDGNGALSSDEAAEAGLEKLVEHFDKIDADGDGEISREEMRAMKKHKERRSEKEAE